MEDWNNIAVDNMRKLVYYFPGKIKHVIQEQEYWNKYQRIKPILRFSVLRSDNKQVNT